MCDINSIICDINSKLYALCDINSIICDINSKLYALYVIQTLNYMHYM